MDRNSLLVYVVGESGPVLEAAGVALTDTPAGLESPINDALNDIGIAEADWGSPTIPAGSNQAVRKLGLYYALVKAYRLASAKVDSEVDAPRSAIKGSTLAGQLYRAMNQAQIDAAPYFPAEQIDGFSTGFYEIGYTETGGSTL